MRVYLDTVGCRLNQSEIETFARQFRAAGHSLVAEVDQADLVVINTCTVTGAAASDSRGKIRQAHRAGAKKIIVTGCWATLEPENAARLDGVLRVVNNADKDLLVPQMLGMQPEDFDLDPIAREPIPGARLRTRAFIKVQDGCDNKCTFCITTLARGVGQSRGSEAVLADIGAAVLGGVKEVVLTGVHLGSWGADFNNGLHLRDLVETVLARSDVPRVRLSSLEPWDLSPEFFELWENPRLCRHLHLPLQSGAAPTLRRMARKTTPESYAGLVEAARVIVPEMAITTDVIAGFPGETQEEFEESLKFVQSMNFAGGHAFTYSARDGTAAAAMPDQVPHPIRKARNAQVRQVFAEAAADYQAGFIGREVEALWESATAMGPDSWTLSGLTDNYLRVTAEAPRQVWNQITPVKLVSASERGMLGEISLNLPI
jgi:threonylcarbamoyladenosine tRNA methylthiotransferase MtaB